MVVFFRAAVRACVRLAFYRKYLFTSANKVMFSSGCSIVFLYTCCVVYDFYNERVSIIVGCLFVAGEDAEEPTAGRQ